MLSNSGNPIDNVSDALPLADVLIEDGLPVAEITFRNGSGCQCDISPGIMTPSDIELAVDMGAHIVIFFPAETAGCLRMLSGLADPYTHSGIRFIPSGGIDINNYRDYLSKAFVLAVGAWLR